MATDKRARKKDARDATLAARAAELRRRNIIRLITIFAIVGGLAGYVLLSGGDEEPSEPAAQASSEPAEPTEEPVTSGEVACGAEAPPPPSPQQYEAPGFELAEGVDYRAIIHTSCGDIEMDLLEKDTPESVASFIFLSQEGFYDGLTWHRIENNFVIQTGDPNGQNGTEPDGPGYSVPDEFPDKSNEYVYGTVGMANAGPGTTGSQFFVIVHDPDPADGFEPAGLQPLYTIFAVVDEASYETLNTIAALETIGGNDPVEAVKPIQTVFINSIEITES